MKKHKFILLFLFLYIGVSYCQIGEVTIYLKAGEIETNDITTKDTIYVTFTRFNYKPINKDTIIRVVELLGTDTQYREIVVLESGDTGDIIQSGFAGEGMWFITYWDTHGELLGQSNLITVR